VERARLYRAANEACFGVQIATNNIAEGVKAAQLAQDAGAFGRVCGCCAPVRGGGTSSLVTHTAVGLTATAVKEGSSGNAT
jgi:hypothetical protein